MDADEDGDTILGYLDSGLGGDLLRVSPGRPNCRYHQSWLSCQLIPVKNIEKQFSLFERSGDQEVEARVSITADML